nr:hypothetical protein [Tanacetum cinerariifolium]
MMVKRIGELKHIMADLIQVNKDMEERFDSHGSHLHTLEQLDIPQRVSIAELAQDLAEAHKKKKKSRESPKTPPGSPSYQPPPPPPPAVTIQSDFFFNKDLEYLGYGSKGHRPTLSISKMKAAYYPNAGLEQMVPDQFWIKEECKYDFAAIEVESDEDVPGIDAGVQDEGQARPNPREQDEGQAGLNPGDAAPPPPPPLACPSGASGSSQVPPPPLSPPFTNQEECYRLLTDSVDDLIIRHNVSKPLPLGGPPGQVTIQSDFFFNKDLEYLRYGSKGSKPVLSISITKAAYYSDVGLEQMVPDQMWIEEECKTLLLCMDKYGVQMVMQFEIHKFSDGTLHQIDEALDYRVKEFKVNRMNPGLNTRFWIRKDVDRSKEFMFAIRKRLKTRRIFRNLESFVGGRVRDRDYRLLKHTE